MTESAIDFLRADLFEGGVPHDEYRRLRDEDPCSWHTSPSDRAPGYWLLTRHADVHAASIDAATYSSNRGTTSMFEEPTDRITLSRMILINMDPPSHTRYRRLISRAFSPRAIERLEPEVRAMCRGLVETVLPRGECDFVADVASPLPMRVIFALLGVPEADHKSLVQWSNDMINFAGTDTALGAAMRMYGYSDELARARRERPGDDVVSLLLQSEIEGEKLGVPEFNAFFLLLVVAGNETTRNLISGGLLALLENPRELARLQGDGGLALLPGAVEEMLRFVSPIAQFRRTANREVTLHGRTIREGDKVILAHASANRDERVFADADRFDVTRTPNPHVSFGVGAHLCIGAALARLEARVMFEELLPYVRDVALAGPTTRVSSNFISGLKTMPIVFRAA